MCFNIETLGVISNEQNYYDPLDETVSEAIETVYKGSNEKLSVFWNGINLILPIESCISELWVQLVDMLDDLIFITEGTYTASLLSSHLTAKLNFVVNKDGQMLVEASWYEVPLDPDNKRMLVDLNKIIIHKDIFVNQWRKRLNSIQFKLVASGYSDLF